VENYIWGHVRNYVIWVIPNGLDFYRKTRGFNWWLTFPIGVGELAFGNWPRQEKLARPLKTNFKKKFPKKEGWGPY